MKWIALLLLLAAVPIFAGLIRSNPSRAPIFWGLLGFLPFVIGPWNLTIAPYATPIWSGYVRGWEISLLDALAVATLLSMPLSGWRKPANLFLLLLYILSVTLAIIQAKFPMLAWSYVIQLIRAAIVFLAVARVTEYPKGERALLIGLACGIALQAGYAIFARLGGALQTGGSLGHQNLLGFVSHLVLMISFAALISGRWTKIGAVGCFAGGLAVILTVSRATIAISLIGLALTYILCIAARPAGRKLAVGALFAVALVAAFPFANAELQRRFELQNTSFFAADEERLAFERAAEAMIDARPMGVGPNHYVFVANTEGYSERAGVTWASGSRSTNVHNSFLLVTAETGYLGLITLTFLLIGATLTALVTAFRHRAHPSSELLIGLACGIIAMCIHGLVEWMFVMNPTQYLFAISLGMIAGLRNRILVEVRSSAARRKKLNQARTPRLEPASI
nr:O-antigen ligase family protein [uncultured Sphingomonas sp.]